MSYRVDLLFGKESPEALARRVRRIRWLLILAAPLDVLGLVTCTALPGAVLTLVAWQLCDQELDRAEEGLAGEAVAEDTRRLRQIALALLSLCFVGFLLQMYLLSSGVYARLLLPGIER